MQALGLPTDSQGLLTPNHRSLAMKPSSAAEMPQREPGDVVLLVVLAAAVRGHPDLVPDSSPPMPTG